MSRAAVCAKCARRAHLIWRLSGRLDVRRYDCERLAEVLELSEPALLSALGAASAGELPSENPVPRTNTVDPESAGLISVCRHDRRFPRKGARRERDGDRSADDRSDERLPGERCWGAPPVLHLAGDLDRLPELSSAQTVAIVGTRRATDYGTQIARTLARELCEAGLTVLAGLAEGVSAAAQTGALEARAGLAVAAMPGGLDVCSPAFKRGLYDEVLRHGLALSEMPLGARVRRWHYAARNRLMAGLADLVLVVEAEDRPGDLMAAEFARSLGRRVAAIPGRVTSPASRGTHALLTTGASLVRDAADALDLLHGLPIQPQRGRGRPGSARSGPVALASSRLGPQGRPSVVRRARGKSRAVAGVRGPDEGLRSLLARVGAGQDTIERLVDGGLERRRALVGLAELELRGLVARGDGGRYVAAPAALSAPGERP